METEWKPSLCRSVPLRLKNVSSAVDLLVAVRDAVLALRHLFVEHQILHKHIGYNTISVLGDVDNGVTGAVLDLDFPDPAEGSSGRNLEDFGSLTSFAFQSYDQVVDRDDDDPHRHSVHDDLESVFYSLCWACYGYDHTGRLDKFRPGWMEQWITTRHASSAQSSKGSFRRYQIKTHVNRFIGCHRDIMEDVIEKIRQEIYSPSSDPEEPFAAILKIMDKGIEVTKEEPCGTTLECSRIIQSPSAMRVERRARISVNDVRTGADAEGVRSGEQGTM
ncbi:hypothetical protein C8R47DRAFT_1102896 [Mycena vitilis]|nr:hypothetical protein C8R47DRAFT_1102896 [Mycena vitilis]